MTRVKLAPKRKKKSGRTSPEARRAWYASNRDHVIAQQLRYQRAKKASVEYLRTLVHLEGHAA